MAETILIVDDDPEICEILELYLTKEGYDVICALDHRQALKVIQEQDIDLIILDILIPGKDGLELCHEMRELTLVPILFLSGKTAESDKIVGLSVGGDDYIEKPFSPREVVARVKAHLRRQRQYALKPSESQELIFSGMRIDPLRRKVYVNDTLIPLSVKEFELLYVLAKEPKRTFSPNELFQLIWNGDSLGDTRTVVVHISNLRKKIEIGPKKHQYIMTIRGKGYKFNSELTEKDLSDDGPLRS
jgi:DNA-binding response OmpR family regulator